jgi:hypothetical protein
MGAGGGSEALAEKDVRSGGAAAVAGACTEAEWQVGAWALAEAEALTGGTKNDVMSGGGMGAAAIAGARKEAER